MTIHGYVVLFFFSPGKNAIEELMAEVDKHIPTPQRELDKPFMLPVESVYSIAGKKYTCGEREANHVQSSNSSFFRT